jgi:hypothetical protein
MYQNFISYLYEAQHVLGNTSPIIRTRPATTRPTTLYACKIRGCECSFRLLMMGGVSAETCWASYKYEIKFWYTVASCWISYVNILCCTDPQTSSLLTFFILSCKSIWCLSYSLSIIPSLLKYYSYITLINLHHVSINTNAARHSHIKNNEKILWIRIIT